MRDFITQCKKDRLYGVMAVCWLVTVASSFFNSHLLPVELPGVGAWFLFRTALPLTAVLYVVWTGRNKTFFRRSGSAVETWCFVLAAVLLVYSVLSLPRAIDAWLTLRRLMNLCFDLCFFLLMLRLCRDSKLLRLTLLVCGILWAMLMVLGIYEVFCGGIGNDMYDGERGQRFSWFLSWYQYPVVFNTNTNDYAMTLTFFYGILALLGGWEDGPVRRLLVPVTGLTYFLLLATSSRLCLFAFWMLVAAQLLCALLRRNGRRTMACMLACILCIQLCSQYRYTVYPIINYVKAELAGQTENGEEPSLELGNPRSRPLRDQFLETNETTGEVELRNDASAGVRTILLLHAIGCFRDSYGLGVGLGNTEMLAKERAIAYNGEIWSIHCFLARLMGDYGLFAMVPLCVIAWLLLKRALAALGSALRKKRWAEVSFPLLYLAALAAYPVISTASADAQDSIPMWIYLALLVLLSRELPDSRKETAGGTAGEEEVHAPVLSHCSRL